MAVGTGLLSKGITLSYKDTTFKVINDLMEIPELGGATEKVEVTTLADGAKRYINGIKDYGDLEFKFLYDNSAADSSYRLMSGFETAGTAKEFQVELPDGTTFTFSAFTSVKVDGAGVNAPLTFTASLALNSEIVVANPA